jgi:hypothetical protein
MLSDVGRGLTKRSVSAQFLIAGMELLLREVELADRDDVLKLHQQVFGTAVDTSWFDWKYCAGAGEAMGIWCGSTLIALCGGVSRQFFHCGVPVFDLQLADVMVTPQWRGVLTRTGPFLRVSERFYTSRIGADKAFKVGFGFGNVRHVQLAVRLGIGWNSGPVHELNWPLAAVPAFDQSSGAFSELRTDSSEFDTYVETAWESMLSQGGNRYWLGQRDATYIRWRFVDRPDVRYRFLLVPYGADCSPAGVAVVRMPSPSDPRLCWMDWVGPTALLPRGWFACMSHLQAAGAQGLTMWASAGVEATLAVVPQAQRSTAALLGIPNMSALDGMDVTALPWWFMAGDTDFM